MTSDRARAASASSSSASIRSSQAGPMALAFPARIRSTIASPTRSSCMHPLYAPACVPSRARHGPDLHKPSLDHRSLPTQWWQKNRPSGSYFPLSSEPLVVFAPELLLPIRLEIIRFVDIAPGARRDVADELHCGRHPGSRDLALGVVRLVARHP